MKKLVLCLLMVAGCSSPNYSKDFKAEVSKNAERCRVYIGLMKDEKTKPEHDKAFIEANATAWKSLEEIVNK